VPESKPDPLPYVQVPGYGTELRALIGSKLKADRELAGIIVDEIEHMCALKAQAQVHPKEKPLNGRLADLRCLVLYVHGESVRVYFRVVSGQVWMLGVLRKRKADLMDGEVDRLEQRGKEAIALAAIQPNKLNEPSKGPTRREER